MPRKRKTENRSPPSEDKETKRKMATGQNSTSIQLPSVVAQQTPSQIGQSFLMSTPMNPQFLCTTNPLL
jgi:hypothetical protein